jgi:acyl carrier protein
MKRIIKILENIRPEFDFSVPVNFIEEGMLDSFDVIRAVTDLENEFGISIDGMDIIADNFSSLEKISTLVHKNGIKP